MLFRRLKIWRAKRQYRKKIWHLLRNPKEIVGEIKRSEQEYLKAARAVKPTDKTIYYWRGRYEGLKWIFKDK